MSDSIYVPMPELVIPAPYCSNCGNDVRIEDGIPTCETCLIEWDDVVEDAVAHRDECIEGTDVVCGSTDTSKAWGIPEGYAFLPCSLPTEHTGPHHFPYRRA